MKRQRFNPRWEQYRDSYVEYCINRFSYKNEYSKNRCYYDYKTTINQLYDYLVRVGVKKLNEINTEHLIDYQKFIYTQLGLIPHTIKHKIAKLRLFFAYLVNQGILHTNPFNNINLLPELNQGRIQIKRYYSIQELIDRYYHALKKAKLTKINIEIKLRNINLFMEYLNNIQRKDSLYKVTEQDINSYREYLKQYQYEPGKYYSPHNQILALRVLKQFFRNLYVRGYLPSDIMQDFNCREHKQELEALYSIRLDPPDPDILISEEIRSCRDKFIEYLLLRGYAKKSVEAYKFGLKIFTSFLHQKGVRTIKEINKTIIEGYQTYLKNDIKTKQGKSFTLVSIAHRLMQLKVFMRYLVRKEYINTDYTAFIDTPRIQISIPHSVMTEREIELILSKPDILTPVGLRDKAVLETLYSTGIRANEMANVKIQDVDLENGLIRIETPKGGDGYKRVVPIGRLACYYIKKYLKASRPELLRNKKEDNEYLILTTNGNKTNNHIINEIARKYAFMSGIRKHISAHSFRVTCATLMLQNDADIRYVQEQLGHKCIRSTQIYTRVVPKDLKRIHQMCHPREKENKSFLPQGK